MNNNNQRIQEFRRFGELTAFDFHDIPQDIDVESDLTKFLVLAEINVVLFGNDSIFDVANNVVRDKHPFILRGTIKTNDTDPTSLNTFFKDITALNKWIEKNK